VIPAKQSVIPAKQSVIPAKQSVIPAKQSVIPAKQMDQHGLRLQCVSTFSNYSLSCDSYVYEGHICVL
jgi:hypothetical protein